MLSVERLDPADVKVVLALHMAGTSAIILWQLSLLAKVSSLLTNASVSEPFLLRDGMGMLDPALNLLSDSRGRSLAGTGGISMTTCSGFTVSTFI